MTTTDFAALLLGLVLVETAALGLVAWRGLAGRQLRALRRDADQLLAIEGIRDAVEGVRRDVAVADQRLRGLQEAAIAGGASAVDVHSPRY